MKKKSKLSKEIQSSRCLYENNETETLLGLITDYQNGKFDKYQFILKMHLKYNVLFELQSLISQRPIHSLLIEADSVIITLEKNNLRFALDASCRSALFELLNFGSYEYEELQMTKNLLSDHDVFFDVGSHLGWYSIILAKDYQNNQFYAFEPVLNTYNLFKKNIDLNNLSNIRPYNFGFSNEERTADIFYSEKGSAIASEKDIFDMKSLNTVECRLRKIDDFVSEEKIEKIDFIKCDVEGAEFLVIKGGASSIKEFLPILFLELVENWCNKFNYSIADVTNFLFPLGYKIFQIKGSLLHPVLKIDLNEIGNFNYLFLHKNKHIHFIRKYECPQ